MEKYLVFDMDGTIADLYGVDGWLYDLTHGITRPYEIAEPLYDMDILNSVLHSLKEIGWKIIVTTWLAKGADSDYKDRTRTAKREWLARYNFPFDEIHLVKYGTTKANCTRKHGGFQILVDDNSEVRKGWKLGNTIDARGNIIEALKALL